MHVLPSPERKRTAGLWERGLEPELDTRHVGAELPAVVTLCGS